MSSEGAARPRTDLALGIFLIALACAILYFSSSIRLNDFGNEDPGPRAVPRGCAIIMLLGGIYELFSATITSRKRLEPKQSTETSTTDFKRGVITFIGLVGYLIAMNWLGFNLSTLLFASLGLVMLGSRWWAALFSSVCIVLVVQLLFVRLFQVSLPLSPWGSF